MRTNGSISIKVEAGIKFDENRKPIQVADSWGDPIQCRFTPNKYSEKGISNGNKFTVASYDILIETQVFSATSIRLTDGSGNVIGEYQVQQIENIPGVGRIRITV